MSVNTIINNHKNTVYIQVNEIYKKINKQQETYDRVRTGVFKGEFLVKKLAEITTNIENLNNEVKTLEDQLEYWGSEQALYDTELQIETKNDERKIEWEKRGEQNKEETLRRQEKNRLKKIEEEEAKKSGRGRGGFRGFNRGRGGRGGRGRGRRGARGRGCGPNASWRGKK